MPIPTSGPIVPGDTPTTLTELRQQVSDFLARSDLDSFIDSFITLAENTFNYGLLDEARAIFVAPLRVREMEETVTLEPTSGICDMPSNFLQHIQAKETGSFRPPLDYITPDVASMRYANIGGIAQAFTIVGEDLITYPATDTDIELIYYRTIPPLITNETNWLLQKCPSLYLQATLAVANDFIKDASGNFDRHFTMTKALMGGLNRSGMTARYARAGLQSRGVCP